METSDQLTTDALETTTPHCYRHPARATKVSCGRCGKPLCPDCVQHGPVGVRCADCLRPPKVEVQLAAPQRVGLAIGVSIAVAFVWTLVLVVSCLIRGVLAPNLLLSAIGGGLVGWLIWRLCGRSYNPRTVRWALALGVAMPLLAALLCYTALIVFAGFPPKLIDLQHIVRTLAAIGLSALFAWLLTTQRRWERDLFGR